MTNALPTNTSAKPDASSAPRRCWIVTDGKAGVETQCLAIAEELGLEIDLKRIVPRRPWAWLAPYGPVDPAVRFARPGSAFSPPWPEIIISCGRLTVPYMRALHRAAGRRTFTVFLQDPRTGAGTADLIWVPAHDRRRGPNVFTTLTTPHRLTLDRLARRRASMPAFMVSLPAPRVAVLIGGNSRSHTFTERDQGRLINSLASLAAHAGSLFVTPSRRTPPLLARALQQFMDGRAGVYWDGTGENPLHDFIAHADHLVVTADSANMVCEACVSGRPVHVFHPSGGSRKFDRLHHALEAHGAVRPLKEHYDRLEDWQYPPLSATETIAVEIERRWALHAAAQ